MTSPSQLLSLSLFVLFLTTFLFLFINPSPSIEKIPSEGNSDITHALIPLLQQNELPAIGAALITHSTRVKIGVAGVRKAGKNSPVNLDSRWHLGSCAKAMCATLVAKMVELDYIKWDTTIKEAYPKRAADFQSNLGEATLLHLLTHTAGLPRDADYHELKPFGNAKEQRRHALIKTGSKQQNYAIGDEYAYSNLGYILVGALLENITKKSYESLMHEYIFEPLEMHSAGFECATPLKPDQLWSHDAEGKPVDKKDFCHNDPPALRPAGCVRSTLEDWSKFIRLHLLGAQGQSNFLKPQTFKRLHSTLFTPEYALGWVVLNREWAGGKVLHHAGSNTFNIANVWIAPKKQFAVLAVTNQGEAYQAADEAVGALIEWHNP